MEIKTARSLGITPDASDVKTPLDFTVDIPRREEIVTARSLGIQANASDSHIATSQTYQKPSWDSDSDSGSTMASVWNNVKELDQQITDEEVADIAAQYGTDEAHVRGIVRLYRGKVSSKGAADTVKGTMDNITGWVFNVFADLPQKAYQTMQGAIAGTFFSEEHKQQTLELWDTVRELTRERRTGVGIAAEFGVGLIPISRAFRIGASATGKLGQFTGKMADEIAKTPLLMAKPLATAVRLTPQAAMGAGIGAGAGLAQSRSGEEWEGIKTGAQFGAILTYAIPMGIMGVVRLASYPAGKILNVFSMKKLANITEEVEKELVTHTTRERALFEAGYRKNTTLKGFTDEEIIEVAKQVGAFKNKNIINKIMAANPGMTKAAVVQAIQKAGKSTPEYIQARDALQKLKQTILQSPAYQAARQKATEMREKVRNTKEYVDAKKAADDARKATGVDSPEYKAAYSKFKEIRQKVMTSSEYKKVDKAASKLTNKELHTPEYARLQKAMGEAQLGGKMKFGAYRKAVAEEISEVARKEFIEFADVFLPSYTQLTKRPEDFIDILESITDKRAIIALTRTLNLPKAARLEIEQLLEKGTSKEAMEAILNVVKKRELGELKSHMTLESLEKFVSDVAHTEGSEEAMLSLWNKFRFGKLANKVMIDPLKVKKPGLVSKFFYGAPASQHVLHDFDRRTGSDLGFWGMRLNTKQQQAENVYFRERAVTVDVLEKVHRTYFGRYPEEKLLRSLRAYIEEPKQWTHKNGKIPEGFEEYRKLHSKTMEYLRGLSDQYGVKIDKLTSTGYVHQSVKPSREVDNILRAEVKRLRDQGIDLLETRLTPKQFKTLVRTNSEVKDVVDSVRYLSDGVKIESTDELVTYWARLQNTNLTDELIMRVNTFGYHRSKEHTIPGLIRENNTLALTDKWLKESMNFAITREPLREISKWISVFEKRGLKEEAAWLNTYIKQATGLERSIWSRVTKGLDEFVDDHITNPMLHSTLKGIPTVASMCMNALYGSLLAGPKSFGQNLEQPITKMAHAIGETIGMDYTLRAYVRSTAIYMEGIENIMKGRDGELKVLLRTAREKGLIPSKQIGEALNKTKLDRTAIVANAITNSFTTLFEASDIKTRVVALSVAGDLAVDILKRKPKVLSEFVESSLNRYPSVQREVRKLAAAGKREELTDVISEHLLQTEMFTYNTTSKSRYMHKLGPYMTMFSKWPTEVLGDVMGGIRAGEAQQTFIRVVTPLLQMGAIATYLQEHYQDLGRGAKKAFDIYPGKPTEPHRYMRRTPIESPLYLYDMFINGEALRSPVIAPAVDGLKALFGDEKAKREFWGTHMYNISGFQLIEHLFENWPRIFKGVHDWKTGEESDIDIPDFKKVGKKLMRDLPIMKTTTRGVKDIYQWLEEKGD